MIYTLAQLTAAGLVGAVFLYFAWQRPGLVAASVISIAAVLDILQIGADGLTLGVNIYVDDLAVAVLVLIGVLSLLRYRRSITTDTAPCLMLLVLIGVNLGRGVDMFGLKPAGNSARNLLTFVAPALGIMLLRPVIQLDASRLTKWLSGAAGVLCSIACLRWAGVLPMPFELQDTLRDVVRALPSDYAIVIGQALIGVTYLLIIKRGSARWWVCAGIFAVVTLVLQHRSVWTATLAGLTWLLLRTVRSAGRWLGIGAAGAVTLGLVMVASPKALNSVEALVSMNVQEVESRDSTWAWRVQGYTEAVDRIFAADTVDMLFGPPAGWAANLNASFASTHIHSRYVDTLAYYGITGACFLSAWFLLLIKRGRSRPNLIKGRQDPDGSSSFLQAILIAELVYLIPYFGGLLQGATLGLLWIALTQKLPTPRRAATKQTAPVQWRPRVPLEPTVS